MELFLLFSLALTCVAFLSIVLSDPPSPLVSEIEAIPVLDRMATTVATLPEAGILRQTLDHTLETAAFEVALEEYAVAS